MRKADGGVPALPVAERWALPRPRLARMLKGGFVLLALATAPKAVMDAAPLPANPGAAPLLGPTGLNPISNLVAQGLNQALQRANQSGALPPLVELNARLLDQNPQHFSLVDLTARHPPTPQVGGLPTSLPPLGLTEGDQASASSAPLTQEMVVALYGLSYAQLNQGYFLLHALGNQFVADAFFVHNNTQLAAAFEAIGNELQAVAYSLGVIAFSQQADLAEHTYLRLQEKALAANSAPAPPPSSQDEMDAVLSAAQIYGLWERLAISDSQDRLQYRIAPNRFEKVQITLDAKGRRIARSETQPGAITASVEYELPGDGAATDAASPAKAILVIEKANGDTVTLEYALFQLQKNGTPMLVLVEADGDRTAFVKLAKP